MIVNGILAALAIYTVPSIFAGVVATVFPRRDLIESRALLPRADSPTDVCVRWSHQSAVVNGTLYVYGGQASNTTDQKSDTWNNDFLTLDLTKSWQISSPALNGLPQPSGPPAVANAYLWNSLTSVFLYGGLYSDHPVTNPDPFSLWEYSIQSSSWTNHQNPKTSAGNNSEVGGAPVQRAAEGAGANVPLLGRGWFFGGHLDGYTTPGWSQSIPRVYLKSLIEYTFPGSTNTGIQDLAGGKSAGPDGEWRNITQGGLQEGAGFPERADGVFVFVPAWGKEGVIVGLGGGTNESFSQMNVVDIYDVATSQFFKQATSGTAPSPRVNPCAVVAAAPDGSSFNIHLYGGQNLIPYGSQVQYDDMWILSLPSFTWISVDTTSQSIPPARAGHTCNAWNAQMVVVGGYVGQNLSCDSPGIYIFNMSSLTWQNTYEALAGAPPLNQQTSQQQAGYEGLQGSYGYLVPDAVQKVIGGKATGGATATAPKASATAGPVASGALPTFTVSGLPGSSGSGGAGGGSSGGSGGGSGGSGSNGGTTGPNKAAIGAGVAAAFLFCCCIYLAFCAYIYRRQVQMYRRHLLLTQQHHANMTAGAHEKDAFLASKGLSSTESSTPRGRSREDGGGADGVGAPAGDGSGLGYAGAGGMAGDGDEEDLLRGREPTFVGVLLSPRRSLRVINRD